VPVVLKGWFGEKKTELKLSLSLDDDVYIIYHNIVIPSRNGTTQIDHVIASPFGLFIVETKNLKGWIYGTDTQPTWTQVVYQSKYKFQNPLRQSYRHKKALSNHLRIKEKNIHQVVSFVGDCQFKTDMPPNVIKSGLGSYIKGFNEIVYSDNEVKEIQNILSRLKSEVFVSTKKHIQSLHDRHSSITTCPNCGSNLVERTVKKGPNTGSQFLGCEDYPKCRFSKNIPQPNQNEPTSPFIKVIIALIVICTIYYIIF
jgi:restriction system protein